MEPHAPRPAEGKQESERGCAGRRLLLAWGVEGARVGTVAISAISAISATLPACRLSGGWHSLPRSPPRLPRSLWDVGRSRCVQRQREGGRWWGVQGFLLPCPAAPVWKGEKK